jgi:hypothetical protein
MHHGVDERGFAVLWVKDQQKPSQSSWGDQFDLHKSVDIYRVVNTTMWIWRSGPLKGKSPAMDYRRLCPWQVGLPILHTDACRLLYSERWAQILHLSCGRTDPQRIFWTLTFPSSINVGSGPNTRVVRRMVTIGNACNAHKHGQTEITLGRWLLRGIGRHSACERGHWENEDKYKTVGWYVTMVRVNVTERKPWQPIFHPTPSIQGLT